ncbi:hypothetical protein ANN_18183 [Periplaneta americana]|uniref:Tc1-like transposase DDE domain-containing protein n=1 Tax=Periplaneta americana TaxID=6978 RepID=A0ABQ8SN19_PERAM|nr:hypothetical protein ANN_18183 [Periplaneta americana]
MSPGSSTESYPAFARIGLRKKPRKKPQPGNLPRPGFEPWPPGFAARRADRYSTVNGERYYSMLQNFVISRLRNHDMENIIFMQDGSPPHIFIPAKQLITQIFGDRVISRHFPTMWPPRPPDVNPADFRLWGYLKNRVFLTHPTTLLQLKDAISQDIANIPRHYLQNAVHGVADRMLAVGGCISVVGGCAGPVSGCVTADGVSVSVVTGLLFMVVNTIAGCVGSVSGYVDPVGGHVIAIFDCVGSVSGYVDPVGGHVIAIFDCVSAAHGGKYYCWLCRFC